METIIRSPSVSLETRQLKRRSAVPSAAPTAGTAETPVAVHQTVNFEPTGAGQESASSVAARTVNRQIEQELASARLQIDQELANARAQIEQEIASSSAAAEREGYAKGMEKAEEAARQAVTDQVARLESIMATLANTRASVIDGAEDAIVEIAYTAICRIIGTTAIARAAVIGMVDQVLATFKERDKLVVRLNPQDFELLQQTSEVSVGREAALRADASIRIGGCVVESGNGFLDATLETQLARLGEALLSARRQREDGGDAA